MPDWKNTPMRRDFDELNAHVNEYTAKYAGSPESDINIRLAMDAVLNAMERLDGWMSGDIVTPLDRLGNQMQGEI